MKFRSYNLLGELGDVEVDLKKILGKGATAVIYAASAQGHPCAAKIYHQNNTVDDAKIRAMLANAPANVRIQIAGGNHPQLAWPFALIREPSGENIGYLMPVVDLATSFSLDHYYDQTLIKKLKSPSEDALSFKLEIARNLSLLVADLHDHGHYFIDFKPQNIRVSLGSHVVTLVDCDGFSIAGTNGKRYPADLVSTDYISPEASKGNLRPTQLGVAQDLYALAVILFQLFNRGTHPFQGIVNSPAVTATTNDEKAAQGLYPHGLIANPYITPRPQSIHNFLDDGLRSLFDKAFIGVVCERPTAREWSDCLDKLLRNKGLSRCDLHPYDLTHMRFTDKQCPTCYLTGIQHQEFPSSRATVAASVKATTSSTANSKPPSPTGFSWILPTIFLFVMLGGVFLNTKNKDVYVDRYKSNSNDELCAAYFMATSEATKNEILTVVLRRGYKAFDDMCPPTKVIQVQPAKQVISPYSTARCAGSYEPAKCEAREAELQRETPEQASERRQALESERQRNLAIVNGVVGTCSREVLATRSTSKLCSLLGSPRNTCSGSEVREELERRGVFVYEGGCGNGSSPKSNGTTPRTQSQAKVDSKVARSRYLEILKDVEARIPELNPDSPLHRNDLTEIAAKRKESYMRQGMPDHEALARAVADLERQSVFRVQQRTEPSVPVEAPKVATPRVIDPGGHTGFPAKCRWVTYKDWSCD